MTGWFLFLQPYTPTPIIVPTKATKPAFFILSFILVNKLYESLTGISHITLYILAQLCRCASLKKNIKSVLKIKAFSFPPSPHPSRANQGCEDAILDHSVSFKHPAGKNKVEVVEPDCRVGWDKAILQKELYD